jgi:hypothetical protein
LRAGVIGDQEKETGGRRIKVLANLRRPFLCLPVLFVSLTVAGVGQTDSAVQGPSAAATENALPDAPQAAGGQVAAAAGSVHGTVVDKDGAVYEGAHVTLTQTIAGVATARAGTTDGDGRFGFADVMPGAFTLTVTSTGFAQQVVTGQVVAGENVEAKAIVLMMSSASADVEVHADTVEIAEAQLKVEETQRVLGVIPNFYVSYVPNAAPLTKKQKYELGWRSSIDPVTFLGVGVIAGAEQATNTFPGYGEGMAGYGKRYGAAFGDSFFGTMIGGAILPAWWKQDPRYFYKGTGSVRSRAGYAIAMSVVARGDNGKWQPAYAAIVGGLAAGGISNLYYPAANRDGVGLTFENAALGTAESAVQNLLQEFLIRKLTPKLPNYSGGKP